MTNVSISWSGDLSKQIAEELRTWIPSVLQFAKPYFTPNDIEKGSKWGSEIAQKLSETQVGIICLTRENYERPWILFEAGALSKDLDSSKVCSILFGMEQPDLSGPLTTFQTTAFDRRDFKKLLSSVNEAGGEQKLDNETFDNVFDMWWPHLEKSINKILDTQGPEATETLRSDRELLEEVLSLSRISAKHSAATRSRRTLPKALVKDLISISEAILQEAMFYKDPDILRNVRKLLDVTEYLNRSALNNEVEISDAINKVSVSVEGGFEFIDNSKSDGDNDDEVPL